MTRATVDIPRLHLVGPLDAVSADEFVTIARRAAEGGCDAVHLRLPGASGGDMLALARAVLPLLPSATRLIVNDRVDVAVLAAAGGVQLGERGIPVADARRLSGPEQLIGRSVHDIPGALAAEQAGADYLLAGHVFDTPSHPGEPGRGLDWLRELSLAARIPVIAIGGISLDRIEVVLEAGAHGIALGRELLTAPDPRAAARTACASIDRFLIGGR